MKYLLAFYIIEVQRGLGTWAQNKYGNYCTIIALILIRAKKLFDNLFREQESLEILELVINYRAYKIYVWRQRRLQLLL